MNSMKSSLQLNNVSFQFNAHALAFFKNLTISFAPSMIHFIKGQNGAGKSTLFRLLQGKIRGNEKASGTILLNNTVFDLATAHAQGLEQHIKIVQQKFDLMLADQFSFEENLRCARLPHYPTLSSLPKHAPLPPFIERFGINPAQQVKLLSGGQRQILAILMALQKPTKILLLDEPTAALDIQNSHMVMDFLQELVISTGITVIIICHSPELVSTYAKNGFFRILVDNQQLRTIEYEQLPEHRELRTY